MGCGFVTINSGWVVVLLLQIVDGCGFVTINSGWVVVLLIFMKQTQHWTISYCSTMDGSY